MIWYNCCPLEIIVADPDQYSVQMLKGHGQSIGLWLLYMSNVVL